MGLKIFGYEYTVISNGDISSMGAWGRCHNNTLVIQLATDLAQQQMASTMLHEILEAINSHLELGLEEKSIMGLETGLYQTFHDNGVDITPLLTAAGIKHD